LGTSSGCAKLGQLIGIPKQRENAIADQVGGGEVAGDQQQVAGDDDLLRGQAIPRLLGLDHHADQIGAAATASRLDRARNNR
jgi:hypothetical protein